MMSNSDQTAEMSSRKSRQPDVSLVIPVYFNADTLKELHMKVRDVLRKNQYYFEIIFVEDGSSDNSLKILRSIAKENENVIVISLEKNIGQQRAVITGLAYSRGNKVVIMDADLQDPPEAIPILLENLSGDIAAVFGGRSGHYQSDFRLFCSRVFKMSIHLLTGIPVNAGIFVAMKREMVEKLLKFHSLRPFMTAMIGLTGLPVKSITVKRNVRATGRSRYSTWNRLVIGVMAIAWTIYWKLNRKSRSSHNGTEVTPVKEFIGKRYLKSSIINEQSVQGR